MRAGGLALSAMGWLPAHPLKNKGIRPQMNAFVLVCPALAISIG